MPAAVATETKQRMLVEDPLLAVKQDDRQQDRQYVLEEQRGDTPPPAQAPAEAAAAPVVPEVPVNEKLKTVFIFDWDDTLLASSHLAVLGYTLDDSSPKIPAVEAQLRILERSINAVLEVAMRLTNQVHIVTNAEYGWVQMSCKKFLPNCWPLVSQLNVISARTTYETLYPNDPIRWKFHAMMTDVLRPCYGELSDAEALLTKNVLGFGDSQVERTALRQVMKDFNGSLVKNIKFVERPSLEQLTRELDFVHQCLGYLYSHSQDLDLMLTISML